ncbi:endonuclease/exonuclease/phosphatase family protein [Actinomadura miaoliensis]|uniref:Endonuclease/exonuclease/phosphatase domain-containing protein n=1 Tax=Actinomadura miaoliensis TaxID=430685 RepID=A0ABP7W903_9ACTN
MPRLTVGTWNIKDGGLSPNGDDRLWRQVEVMDAHPHVDVWAIQEAQGWAANGRRLLHQVAASLEMPGRYLVPSNHHGCDLVVLVRERPGLWVVQEQHDTAHPWWHALAHLALLFEGMALHVMNVHLAPSNPQVRLAEAQCFGLFRDWNVIAMGDFNAMPAGPLPTGDIPAGDKVQRKLDQRPAQALAEAGFHDVATVLSDPTPTVGHSKPGGLAYRCDRIVSTLPPDTYTSYQVLDGQGLSDHRAVIATFDLTNFRQPAERMPPSPHPPPDRS